MASFAPREQLNMGAFTNRARGHLFLHNSTRSYVYTLKSPLLFLAILMALPLAHSMFSFPVRGGLFSAPARLRPRRGLSLSAAAPGPQTALKADRFLNLTVQRVLDISHNTKTFDIALPHENDVAGLVPASFVLVKGSGDDVKPYTPVSPCGRRGTFRLVVKRYPGSGVSSHLHRLSAGDIIEVKGPVLKLPYAANMRKRIGMIAGGTGITPMLQLIREILRNPDDATEVSLLFANTAEEDILLKNELDRLAEENDRFKVSYILSQPSPAWGGHHGYVSGDLIATTMPPPCAGEQAPLIFVCGPPGMMEAVSGDKSPDKSQGALTGLLKSTGYTSDMVFKF